MIFKKTKKLVLLLILALMLPLFTVSAYTPKELSQYAKEISEAKKWELEGQVELTKQNLSTVYNGVTEKDVVWNNHTVQWLSIPKENTAIQTVVWSDGKIEEWDASDVKKTAEDYEAKHPGYIVVGAVNGDFFYIDDTQEPLNYHVQEGDVLRSAWDGDPNWGVIGFNKAKDYAAGLPARTESMYLEKITDVGTEELSVVSGTNVAPSGDGVYVYTKTLNETVDLTGYTVYKGLTSLYREYSGGYFVKGKVDRVESITSLTNVPSGTFYIATKSVELKVDDVIKVEYNLAGPLAGYENVVGYCYPCLSNKQPLFKNISKSVMDGYFTTLNPRTLVGFKEDGSVVLMVIDGRGPVSENLEGATLFQCGELLRLAGCVEGYNLDGGGSSTMMARIDGKLTLINDPSDARQTGAPWGTLRGIGNAILLVMKDPKLKVEQAVGNTITIKKNGEVVNGTLENVKVKVGRNTYNLEGEELVVTGLSKNTEYRIEIEYDIRNNDGTVEHGFTEPYYRTTEDYAFPELELFEENKLGKGSVTLKYSVDVDEEDIKRIFIKCGDKEVNAEKISGRITIEELDTTVENTFTLMVELKNGNIVELGSLKYEANTIPALTTKPTEPDDGDDEPSDNPTPPADDKEPEEKSGCKKDATALVVSFIGLSSLLVLVKKKRQ